MMKLTELEIVGVRGCINDMAEYEVIECCTIDWELYSNVMAITHELDLPIEAHSVVCEMLAARHNSLIAITVELVTGQELDYQYIQCRKYLDAMRELSMLMWNEKSAVVQSMANH